MKQTRVLLLLAIAALIAAFFIFDLGKYLSLEYVKSQQAVITTYFEAHPWATTAVFLVVYVTVTALSLPGALVMTLVAGAVFGLIWGALIVSFASSVGAT